MNKADFGCDGGREYLAGLLRFATDNAEECAAALFERFESLKRIFEADFFALSDCLSGNESVAMLIRIVSGLSGRRKSQLLKSGKKLSEQELFSGLCGLLFGLPNETMYVLLFDKDKKFLRYELLGEGTLNSSDIMPNKILNIVLRAGAKYAALAHNHPSGAAEPSAADVLGTRTVSALLMSVGVELVEHYIVAGDSVSCVIGE